MSTQAKPTGATAAPPSNARNAIGGGRGRPKGRGPPRASARNQPKEWIPKTKLGRLVKAEYIKSMEQVFTSSLAIKEPEIIDFFLKDTLKDQTLRIKPVQKQTRAGQRTRFMAIVALGDSKGHLCLGVKVAKEVAGAIRGAVIQAKLSIIPIKLGYWGNRIGAPHTVPCKVTGKCGSVSVRLIPAPRGAGLVAGPVPKKLLEMAGVEDCFTSSIGKTCTVCNFAMATYLALKKTYEYLSPDMWNKNIINKGPYQEFTDFLSKSSTGVAITAHS